MLDQIPSRAVPKYRPLDLARVFRPINGIGEAEGELEVVEVVVTLEVVEVGAAVVVVVVVELLYQLEKEPLVVAAESAAATV